MTYQFVDREARLQILAPILSKFIAARLDSRLSNEELKLSWRLQAEFDWMLYGYIGPTNWREIVQNTIDEERLASYKGSSEELDSTITVEKLGAVYQ
jgi:hypothetical protein